MTDPQGLDPACLGRRQEQRKFHSIVPDLTLGRKKWLHDLCVELKFSSLTYLKIWKVDVMAGIFFKFTIIFLVLRTDVKSGKTFQVVISAWGLLTHQRGIPKAAVWALGDRRQDPNADTLLKTKYAIKIPVVMDRRMPPKFNFSAYKQSAASSVSILNQKYYCASLLCPHISSVGWQ